MIQGERNEAKKDIEDALEYYSDAAEWFKRAFEGSYCAMISADM